MLESKLLGEKKWIQSQFVNTYEGIAKNTDSIEYCVKRLNLYSDVYGYRELRQNLKNLEKDTNFNSDKFDFNERFYIRTNGIISMVAMCNPKKIESKSVMWISHPLTEFSNLIKLNRNFPYLKVKQCEYTANFFSSDPSVLYDALFENLNFPSLKDCLKGNETKTFHRTNRLSKSRFLKMYECGNDSDKIIDENGEVTWPFDKCDQVRFEFTVDMCELQGVGVNFLSDLIHHPNFFKLLKERFRTTRFSQSESVSKWQRIITIARKMNERTEAARSIVQYLDDSDE